MEKRSQIAILAGGFGTRLRNVNLNIPKSMTTIQGKPLLYHQLLECKKYGFDSITMFLHYKSDIIKDYFGDGTNMGLKIEYCLENTPRGTAGAIIDGLETLDDDFIVLCGDTYFNINLEKFYKYHKKRKSALTLFTHPNNHPYDSDIIISNNEDEVESIEVYPHDNKDLPNLVSSGIYAFNKDAVITFNSNLEKIDLSSHLIPFLINKTKKVYSYKSVEYIKDMGTPERLEMVEKDIINRKPESLSDENKRKAIFIDRDGTLIEEKGLVTRISQIKFFPFSAKSLRRINDSGYLCIVVTNQPVIARGECTFEDLDEIHNKMEIELGKCNSYLDDIYFCPHHQDSGFEGEIPELKINCNCRKPQPGTLTEAKIEHNIDLEKSWLIGNSVSDIEAANRVNCKSILISNFDSLENSIKSAKKPTKVLPDIESAVNYILDVS